MVGVERQDSFTCYPDKLLGAFAGLTFLEVALYTTVLLRQYQVKGSVHDDARTLGRRCGLAANRAARTLDALIAKHKLIRDADGGLHNPFADDEIVRARAEQDRRSDSARESVSRRWQKRELNQQDTDTNVFSEVSKTSIPAVAYKSLSKEEGRKKERDASAGNLINHHPIGPADGHCYWTEQGLNSPDGLVTISRAQIASYAETYRGLTNVEGQIKSALHFFGTEKPPNERTRLLAPWLAKREQEAIDKRQRTEATAKDRARRETERAAKRDKGGKGWSDLA